MLNALSVRSAGEHKLTFQYIHNCQVSCIAIGVQPKTHLILLWNILYVPRFSMILRANRVGNFLILHQSFCLQKKGLFWRSLVQTIQVVLHRDFLPLLLFVFKLKNLESFSCLINNIGCHHGFTKILQMNVCLDISSQCPLRVKVRQRLVSKELLIRAIVLLSV